MPHSGDITMNKVLSLICCFLLLSTPLHSMNPVRKLFNDAIKFNKTIKLFQLIAENKPTSLPKVDPDVSNAALAIALHENDTYIALFLLMHEIASPNYIVNPALITIIKSISNSHTNQSENELIFSKLKDHATSHQPEGLPTFYFAKNLALVKECVRYGKADLSLGYIIPTPYGTKKHGNILTYIIDNADHQADLIPYCLEKGAGAFCPSHASRGGSAAHDGVHRLNIANIQDAPRVSKCIRYLVEAKPDLLNDRDHDGNTPGDCLKIYMEDTNRKDISKFLAVSQLLDAKKRSRE